MCRRFSPEMVSVLYLCSRSQAVNINGTVSSHVSLPYGFPQGSVLGPILLTIDSSPLASIARKHRLYVHAYADDTFITIYTPFDLNDSSDELLARQRAEACIYIRNSLGCPWILKLNDEKTEFLVMTSRHQQHKIHDHDIKVDPAANHASKSARNLEIVFDNNLCMNENVKRICQTVYFHIRNINNIRKILITETAAAIIHALITSRIDNGNSLFTGISERLLCKLQLAQNAAARILTKTRKFEHITPILKELHWLPVRERIQFKLRKKYTSSPRYWYTSIGQY